MHAGPSIGDSQCSATRLLREVGLPEGVSAVTDALAFSVRKVSPRRVLVHEGEPLDTLYVVLAGSFKSEVAGLHGDAQVNAFYFCGDTMGLDGLGDRAWHRSLVALEHSLVAVVPLNRLAEFMGQTPSMIGFFHNAVSREVSMMTRLHYILAPATAEGRLARFLVDVAARQAGDRRLPLTALLTMSRSDLSNHLGLAHETVSRAFAALARIGCIDASRKDVQLLDMSVLQHFRPGRRLSRADGAGAVPDEGEPPARARPW